MPRRWISAVWIAVPALALAAVGCGADEEGGGGGGGVPAEQQVREVVARFGVATRGKDYQQLCDRLLSEELVSKIEGIGLPCESALHRGLGGVRDPTLKINEVSISGGRALVSIHTSAAGEAASNDALQVVREGGEWKIASLAAPNDERTKTDTTSTSTAPRPATKTFDSGK